MALRILGDPAEAEEVLGETFWQIWNSAHTYDPARGTLHVRMLQAEAQQLRRAAGERERLVALLTGPEMQIVTLAGTTRSHRWGQVVVGYAGQGMAGGLP